MNLSPTIEVTQDGKKIYWYGITQIEYIRHRAEMSRIEHILNCKNWKKAKLPKIEDEDYINR